MAHFSAKGLCCCLPLLPRNAAKRDPNSAANSPRKGANLLFTGSHATVSTAGSFDSNAESQIHFLLIFLLMKGERLKIFEMSYLKCQVLVSISFCSISHTNAQTLGISFQSLLPLSVFRYGSSRENDFCHGNHSSSAFILKHICNYLDTYFLHACTCLEASILFQAAFLGNSKHIILWLIFPRQGDNVPREQSAGTFFETLGKRAHRFFFVLT